MTTYHNYVSVYVYSTRSNPSVCDCGEPAILLTVRKEGPNTGY